MEYVSHILILICIYAMLGMATGIIVGLSKMISLGQAAFYGLGAYITALCVMYFDLGLMPSLLIVMFVNGLVGFLLALPAVRLKGDYFILATLAFQFIIFSLLNNLTGITNGSLGIAGIGPPRLFGDVHISGQTPFMLLAIAMAVMMGLLMFRLYYSPFGLALRAMRDEEVALQTTGRNTGRLKILAFILSSVFIGWAAYVFANYMSFIYPGGFHLNESIFILMAVILGGSGTIRGAFAGAAFVILIPEALRFIGLPDEIAAPLKQMIFGLILILVMQYRPGGLLGKLKY